LSKVFEFALVANVDLIRDALREHLFALYPELRLV